jgi:hypothetical protein
MTRNRFVAAEMTEEAKKEKLLKEKVSVMMIASRFVVC